MEVVEGLGLPLVAVGGGGTTTRRTELARQLLTLRLLGMVSRRLLRLDPLLPTAAKPLNANVKRYTCTRPSELGAVLRHIHVHRTWDSKYPEKTKQLDQTLIVQEDC